MRAEEQALWDKLRGHKPPLGGVMAIAVLYAILGVVGIATLLAFGRWIF